MVDMRNRNTELVETLRRRAERLRHLPEPERTAYREARKAFLLAQAREREKRGGE